jgi:hypothetical protein
MTSPPLVQPPPSKRALRLALLAATAAVVIAGLVATVVLVPGHKNSHQAAQPTPASVSPTTAESSPSTQAVSSVPSGPTPIASLGGLVLPPGDPQVELKTRIANAFVQYIHIENDMETTKTKNFTALTEVAADPLYTAIEEGILKFYGTGHLSTGRSIISDLTIASIAAGGQSATLTACEDQTQKAIVDAKTGAVIDPPDPKARIVDAATLRIRDGQWKVTGLTHPSNCS